MMRSRWLLGALVLPFLLLSCSSSEPAATTTPVTVDLADADISQAEAVDIARVVLTARSFADDFETDPQRVVQGTRYWAVHFSLKDVTHFHSQIALQVDMMTGEVEWAPLQ